MPDVPIYIRQPDGMIEACLLSFNPKTTACTIFPFRK